MAFRRLRTLVVDNYDSYTFNLVQYVAQANIWLTTGRDCDGADDARFGGECLSLFVDVVQNDQISWSQLRERIGDYDSVVLSPGPGRPDVPADFGICRQILESGTSSSEDRLDVPILGVCLGHQGLAVQCGCSLELAPRAAHGVQSLIEHCGEGLFEGLPNPFLGVRYHSWVVAEGEGTRGDRLRVSAWTADGRGGRLVMGLEHRQRPIWGVQFHPESVCTQDGMAILKNFAKISLEYRKKSGSVGAVPKELPLRAAPGAGAPAGAPARARTSRRYKLEFKKLEMKRPVEPAEIYHELFTSRRFALSEGVADCSFWLDSSHLDEELGRYSMMGSPYWSAGGSLIEYDQASKTLVRSSWREKVVVREELVLDGGTTLFGWMEERRCEMLVDKPGEYPLPFCGGYVGYFGYEMKYECDLLSKIPREEGPRLLREPDAAWMLVRNFLAFDAREPRSIYVVELRDEDGARESWIERMEGQILRMSAVSSCCAHLTTDAWPRVGATRPSFAMEQDEVSYKEGIRRCLERIGQGESYELCLTNKVIVDPFPLEPYSVYRYLRKVNPAPYAAWLEFPRFWILSSSPEKFLTVGSDGWATSKPIKGTAPRGRTAEQDEELKRGLKASQKEFSENLMVVDLVRHDLGKVCRIGSVGVPELMKVESYRTVHQLVSRVTGRLRGDKSALDCVREMFPPASMTGAPKFRSVRILQELEKFKRRGAYSGALGYVSLSGECDLSVVIRTAVIWRRGAGSVCAVGCGGAIVADSDAEREFEEALLKANSLLYATVKAFYDCATRGETSAGSQAEDVPGSSSRGPARAEGASRDPAGGSDRGAERIVDGFELFFSPIRKTLYRTISPVFVEACDPEARVPIRWVGSRPERFDGVRYLEELGPRGVDLGLERIRSVLSFFSDPQEAYPIIHVTGTNGKGSVCATLSCILEEATYEVGLFTSPFLLSWRESICVNQTPIQASDWDWTLYRIYEATSELRVELSQFEALTVCAFLHFRDRRVDVAVVEVGMGGRLDATNAATKSLVSVVTSVDYDHEAFLGSTLGEIAREKAGILKFGCPAVVSRQVQGEALEVIREAAKRLNVSLASDELAPSALTWEGAQIDPTLFSLRGREQLANLEVVATVLKAVKSQFSLIDLKSIESGLTKVRWPGRKQHVIWTNGVRILIDGAHNPSGVRTLRHFLDVQHPNQKIQWIIGMISTKSHRRCLEQLLRPGDSVWTVPVIPNVSWLHSVDQRALLSLAREVEEDLSESASFSSLGQVLSKLEDPERDQKGLVPVMTGSLHLISNLLELVHARRIQPFGLPAPRFRLLETVLWSPAPDRPLSRFSDLEDHLKRLKRSAQCFGFKLHLNYLRTCLAHHSAEWKRSHAHALKARILVSQDGDASVEASPLRPTNSPYKIQICKFPVDSNNVFLRHKTTNRSLYQSALASASPQADDVVLWNERNEITETTIANVEVKLPSSDGRVQWVTPHASSGLLRGIEREKRIQRGEVLEKVIKIEDIEDREIYLINSLRGRWKAEWVDSAPAQ